MGPFILQWTLPGFTETVTLKKHLRAPVCFPRCFLTFGYTSRCLLSTSFLFMEQAPSVKDAHTIQSLFTFINLVKSLCDSWKLVRKVIIQNYMWQQMWGSNGEDACSGHQKPFHLQRFWALTNNLNSAELSNRHVHIRDLALESCVPHSRQGGSVLICQKVDYQAADKNTNTEARYRPRAASTKKAVPASQRPQSNARQKKKKRKKENIWQPYGWGQAKTVEDTELICCYPTNSWHYCPQALGSQQ